MVNVPKTRRTFCKKRGKHQPHKVTQYKKGKDFLYAQGKRRYNRKQSGYGCTVESKAGMPSNSESSIRPGTFPDTFYIVPAQTIITQLWEEKMEAISNIYTILMMDQYYAKGKVKEAGLGMSPVMSTRCVSTAPETANLNDAAAAESHVQKEGQEEPEKRLLRSLHPKGVKVNLYDLRTFEGSVFAD
ncbi:hypothetical protein A6R68_11131 [Neotoma lepida]|uniref:Uncharacterized protein n=1 Tax=Neotoma lepida TaxID=56216 RepID=A0A1A6FX56_NEOLE|nr:hypothetical protein A6R68_11131 [Neotoma lepida]